MLVRVICGLVFLALVVAALLNAGGPIPLLVDNVHHVDLPRWKPPSPEDEMLFAPCPTEPRVRYKRKYNIV